MKLAIMPTAEMTKGKPNAAGDLYKSADWAVKTSAAQVDSANEPNKSAPIPAMSPTLSPTLLRYNKEAKIIKKRKEETRNKEKKKKEGEEHERAIRD